MGQLVTHTASKHTMVRQLGFTFNRESNDPNFSDAEVIEIRKAVSQHGMIVIPNQNLTRQQQVTMNQKFGRPVILPRVCAGNDPEPNFPEIHRVTNFFADGSWKGAQHSFGGYWHQDGQFHGKEEKRVYSFLHAEAFEIDEGGYTGFADGNVENAKIPSDLLEWCRNHRVKCSATDIPDFKKATAEDLAKYPEFVVHEIVSNHIDTDQEHIYMGNPNMRVLAKDGTQLSTEKSTAKLNEVMAHCEATLYKHPWKTGDLVIWDNSSVFHRSMPFRNDGMQKRMLFRTQAYQTERLVNLL